MRLDIRWTPNTLRGSSSAVVRSPGKTRRDREKAEPALRDLRAMCREAGQTPAADDTEALMNARLRTKSRRLTQN